MSITLKAFNEDGSDNERSLYVNDGNAERRNYGDIDRCYIDDHFERRHDDYAIVPANTAELIKIFHQMRYLVFCEQHPEFNEKHHIDRTEIDSHDEHSCSFLLLYRPLHMYVGGTRVVVPSPNADWYGLPSVKMPGSPFQDGFPHQLVKMAEISRFLLVKERLKMIRAHQAELGNTDLYAQPFRHLVKCIFTVCQDHHLDGCIASLETPLYLRVKKFFGPIFTKFGAPFEHHGHRQGGYCILNNYLEEIKKDHPRIYHFLSESNDPSWNTTKN